MADLRQTRHKLQVAMIALGVIDILAIGLLFSPLVGSQASRTQKMTTLERQIQTKTRQVVPLHDLDKKIVVAQHQIDQFYAQRIPGEMSTVSEALGKVSTQAGVRVGAIKYDMKDPHPVGLQQVSVDADFSGDYLHLIRFMNSLEREQIFFIIDSIELGGQDQNTTVHLRLKLETYLKAAA